MFFTSVRIEFKAHLHGVAPEEFQNVQFLTRMLSVGWSAGYLPPDLMAMQSSLVWAKHAVHGHVGTPENVHAVVAAGFAHDAGIGNVHPVAVEQGNLPGGAVVQDDVVDGTVFAVPEVNEAHLVAHLLPVEGAVEDAPPPDSDVLFVVGKQVALHHRAAFDVHRLVVLEFQFYVLVELARLEPDHVFVGPRRLVLFGGVGKQEQGAAAGCVPFSSRLRLPGWLRERVNEWSPV
jgi:hypothetical protein